MTRLLMILAIFSASAASHADADVAKGEKIFKRCAVCHALEPGKNKLGPSLSGVFGRTSGSVEGFRYSKAMAGAGIVWTEETISAYLENPRTYVKGNRMSFAGLRKEQDRVDLIAYLKTATAE